MLQFGFIIFFQKDIGAKAACKMSVKLTIGDVVSGKSFQNKLLRFINCFATLKHNIESSHCVRRNRNGDELV